METWMEEYTKQLNLAVQEHPEDFFFCADKVPEVLERMRAAFMRGSYNKEGRAIKNTCKVFNIKHTYQEINHFIANHR